MRIRLISALFIFPFFLVSCSAKTSYYSCPYTASSLTSWKQENILQRRNYGATTSNQYLAVDFSARKIFLKKYGRVQVFSFDNLNNAIFFKGTVCDWLEGCSTAPRTFLNANLDLETMHLKIENITDTPTFNITIEEVATCKPITQRSYQNSSL